MPSLEGAQWGSPGGDADQYADYELREVTQGMQGGGWKVQVDGKPRFLPLGSVNAPLATGSSEETSGGGGLLRSLFGGGPKKAKTADLAKDLNKLIAALQDPEKSKDLRQRLEYSGSSSLGSLLLFATQLHQTGHTTEANNLAAAVFSLGASPESVIDAAINSLADRDLEQVTNTFFTSNDWKAYERDLRNLTTRYPRGWSQLAAVNMLLPAVSKRVAGTLPPKPSIDGATLNPEALAAIDATLQDAKGAPDDEAVTRFARENGMPADKLTPQIRAQIAAMLSRSGDEYQDRSELWLIEKPEKKPAKPQDGWSRLKLLGMDALPALAAIASDDTLTSSRNSSGGRHGFYFSSSESDEDRAISTYRAMDRPLSRGELACRMLASTLPREGSLDPYDAQSLADAAMDFWKNHHAKSKLDLLMVFLTEGDYSQKSAASTALASMPDEAAHAAFEKFVLESEEICSTLNTVATYLKLRKTAAKDFFERFSTAVKTQLNGVDLDQISSGYEIKRAGGVDKYLKKLSLFVNGESPRKLILALAKAEKPDTRQITSLGESLLESSPDQFIPVYLEAAASATHAATRSAFLDLIHSQVRYRGYRGRNEQDEAKETAVPTAEIPYWKTLLEDDRKDPSGTPISETAAETLEARHSPGSVDPFYTLWALAPELSNKLILTRAMERIEGKPLSPLPNADKVTAAHLEELLKQLAATKPDAINELFKTWPIEDKLAFCKSLENSETTEKLPASYIEARRLVVAPDPPRNTPPDESGLETLKSLNLKPGTRIDYDLVKNLAESLITSAKKHSSLVISIQPSELPIPVGMHCTANRGLEARDKSRMRYLNYELRNLASQIENENIDSLVRMEIGSRHRGGSSNLDWKSANGTITAPDSDALGKLRELMQSDQASFSLSICVAHRDDLEKINDLFASPQDQDEEDPSSPLPTE